LLLPCCLLFSLTALLTAALVVFDWAANMRDERLTVDDFFLFKL
jgi:hypothetical protein